jgi:putative endonuclease
VYVLVSEASGATYVGVSNDPARRLEQHNGLKPGGAKSTRGARPWTIAATFGPYPLRGEAQQVEHRVKRRRGRARLEFAVEPPADAAS